MLGEGFDLVVLLIYDFLSQSAVEFLLFVLSGREGILICETDIHFVAEGGGLYPLVRLPPTVCDTFDTVSREFCSLGIQVNSHIIYFSHRRNLSSLHRGHCVHSARFLFLLIF